MLRRRGAGALALLLLVAGCSDGGDGHGAAPAETQAPPTALPGSSTDEPLQPPQPTLPAEPEMVDPREDLEDVEAHPWDEVFVLDDGRGIELRWTSEPCRHLDRIEVEYRENVVLLTLFLGRAPTEECDGTAYRARRRRVPEPVGTRSLADGAEL